MRLLNRFVNVRLSSRQASSIKDDVSTLRKSLDSTQKLFSKLDRYRKIMGELDRIVQNWEELRQFYKTIESIVDSGDDIDHALKAVQRIENVLLTET